MIELNFDADMNIQTNVVPIAVAAWERVRGTSPSFFGCAGNFQHDLLHHAKSALQTGAQTGDTIQAKFEQECINLRTEASTPKVVEPVAEEALPDVESKPVTKPKGKK